MNENQTKAFPKYRLVAEYEDGARLTFDGFTWEQAQEALEDAQIEHGDITWHDGVTDENYENGVYHAAVPPPPHLPFPLVDTSGDGEPEQLTIFPV